MKKLKACLFILALVWQNGNSAIKQTVPAPNSGAVSLVILGTLQDAGSPQAGCTKPCCKDLWLHPDHNRMVVALGLTDEANQKKYLVEASPDFNRQLANLYSPLPASGIKTPDGILLTHAHIGHYTGLMYLGKEAMNAAAVPVYCMPRMKQFLEQNGPWSQLVTNRNIVFQEIRNGEPTPLTNRLQVVPFTVPHRDEFSETVGYQFIGPNKKALFIPDIDKWEKWGNRIEETLAGVDYAFIDGTFYDGAEIKNRDISTIPHPFITESMQRFRNLPAAEKKKIYFIHFNHTNPVINPKSKQHRQVIQNGFNVAQVNRVFSL